MALACSLAALTPIASACAREGVGDQVAVVDAIVSTPSPKPPVTPAATREVRSEPVRSTIPAHPAGPRVSGDIEWPWVAIADCESGDGPHAAGPPYHPNWSFHDGSYDGGLNFAYSTWDSAWHAGDFDGPKDEIPSGDAWQHSARVQVDVAKDWLKRTSWAQWPVCSRAVGVR